MTKLEVALEFKRAASGGQYAIIAFDEPRLNPEELSALEAAVKEEPSCVAVEFYDDGAMVIDAVEVGHPAEQNFTAAVEAIARRLFTVKKVTQPKK